MTRLVGAVLAPALVLIGCPTPEEELPEVAGTYPLAVTLIDGDCLSQDPDLPPTSFLTWLTANGAAGMLDIEQDGGDLVFRFETCDLGGTVDVNQNYYAGGDCAADGDDVVTITSYGTLGPDAEDSTKGFLDGYVRIDVDYRDSTGAGSADGELDCFREVQISGTSF